jgi:photosystem II stability/assembly factor-like uncharacterized protein
MKKSLLFILLVASVISFGIFITADKTEVLSEQSKTPFEQKIEKKEARAAEFFKWREEMLTNVETGEVSPADYYKALSKVNQHDAIKAASKTNTVGLEWTNRGPDNQGGRTRTMLFLRDDANVVFTGSVSGGLFKSVDAGNTWERVSSYFLNNSAVVSLSQGADGDIFVGTGEALGNQPNGDPFTPATIGSGIYKSTDLGVTWESVSETNPYYNATTGIVDIPAGGYTAWDWSTVSRLESHPTNKAVLLAGTRTGLKISNNADATNPTAITFTAASVSPNTTSLVSDIKLLPNGLDGWAAIGGRVYKTTDVIGGSWNRIDNMGAIGSRAQIAVSSLDSDGGYYVYASLTNGSGCLEGIFKSVDKGANWTQIAFASGPDPFGQPTGGGCQGWYDHCIAVNPVDRDKIYIGGITLYTWSPGSGGLTRADKIGSEGGEHLDPDYIHADKHGIFFNPHDITGNTMYITSDGGIARTINAFDGFPDNMVYSEQNRNYTTFQCYTVGSGKYGEVISGGQDNGTLYVDYKGISPKAAKEVSGGDGVAGAEVSNFNIDATFSGVYYGSLRRSMNNGVTSSNFLSEAIDIGGCGHITCTPVTTASTCENKEQEGQNFVFPFMLMETYDRLTPRYDARISAKDEIINLPGGGQILLKDTIQPGNVINNENFTFDKMPKFDTKGLDLEYNLANVLMPGESDSFAVPFDSKYFVPTKCGNNFFVCTNPIQDGAAPLFSSVNIVGQSSIKRMDHSHDGDMVAAVTSNGRVIIMQGWDAYDTTAANINSVTYETVLNVAPRLSGVSIDRNNKDRIVVTAYGYGGTNKVFLCENATSANPTFTAIQGDLPVMPVYACVIDKENSQRIIIGTEFGVYASNDGGDSWTAENIGLGARMPIYTVRQEWVNNFDCYLLSAAALGGGMFTSESLSSCAGAIIYGRPLVSGIDELSEIEVGSVVVYPNPVAEVAKIAFNLSQASNVTIKIVDLSGKIVQSKSFGNLSEGAQNLEMNVSDLASSTYFTVISASDKAYGNKLFIKK